MLPARQQGGHQEGSHLSLTWVVVPILFSLGDVSTDVANPLERVTGIEPVIPTWKDGVLPLHHTREAIQVGLEPTTDCLEGSCSIQLSY